MTAIDRRSLLLAAAGLPLVFPGRLSAAATRDQGAAFISACGHPDGGFAARFVTAEGKDLGAIALPGRGHGAVYCAARCEVVLLARRPGRFALVVDTENAVVTRRFEAPYARHFYGHGVFSRDGRWLFATENDFETGRGVIGVYDGSAGYRREGELPSHGLGPHELALLPDGRRLAVANGGIRTHPDSGRRKLNLDTMAPSLAYVDSTDGTLLHRAALAPELHQLSIRHLAVSREGRVCLALQYEGARNRLVPLVGFQQGSGEIALADTPAGVLRRMRHYCGGAALDESGEFLAVSAPRGGLVTFWSVAEGRYLAELAVADGCGLARAPGPGRFLISSGQGRLLHYDVAGAAAVTLRGDGDAAWDNHLLAL